MIRRELTASPEHRLPVLLLAELEDADAAPLLGLPHTQAFSNQRGHALQWYPRHIAGFFTCTREKQSSYGVWNFSPEVWVLLLMPDFPIDPQLRIRVSPPGVLSRTTEAMAFIRKMTLDRSGRAWLDVQQSFEDAWDDWSAMEAVVKLEMLLEAEGLLIEDKSAPASPSSLQNRARAA